MNWIQKTDQLKALIDASRPLNKGELKALQVWLRVTMTYHSNAIEGSTLTEEETRVVIEDGLTIGGKTIREIEEVKNHAGLVDQLFEVVKTKKKLTEKLLNKWQKQLLTHIDDENAGVYRKVSIAITGTSEKFPLSSKVSKHMKEFFKWFNDEAKDLHSISRAAHFHHKLVKIHPYVDGNGRIARLAMNIILMKSGYPPTIIPLIRRSDYMKSLKNNLKAFESFISEMVYENTKDYCRMVEIKIKDN
jgi:Fic family protein